MNEEIYELYLKAYNDPNFGDSPQDEDLIDTVQKRAAVAQGLHDREKGHRPQTCICLLNKLAVEA